jgi:predicted ATPase
VPNPLAVRIENFRSIERADLDLTPGLNILIGPNGSGKTNLVAGLKFLREILLQGVGLALAKSGGSVRNYRRGETSIAFSVQQPFGSRVFRRKRVPFTVTWNLEVSQTAPDQLASITREELSIIAVTSDGDIEIFAIRIDRTNAEKPKASYELVSQRELGNDLFSAFTRFAKQSKNEMYHRVESGIQHLLRVSREQADRSIIPQLSLFDEQLSELYTSVTDLNEYNIQPDIARQSTDQLPFAEIAPNGAGLSEVIHALRNRQVHRILNSRDYEYVSPRFYYRREDHFLPYGTGSRYSRRMRLLQAQGSRGLDAILNRINTELSAGVRSVDGVTTDIDPSNGRRFVVFKSGDHEFSPQEVSDGTIKWLSILTSIFVPFSSTYVLEEPENFLHPWMQQQLIRIMREQSVQASTIFLITTHSATVLNAAMPDEIIVVSRPDDGTVTSRLRDREHIQKLLETTEFGLGDLWVSGAIGGVPGGED